jgi:FkbM family methyltransferase
LIPLFGLNLKKLEFIYKFIYHPYINPILRRINKVFSPFTNFQLPPSGTITLKVEGDKSFKMSTNQTSYVTKLLYWRGADSFEYTIIFKDLIKKCHVFIDVGANSGYYSLLASSLNKRIKVFSFEPAQGPLYFLKKNVSINKFENQIEVKATALSSQKSEILFYEVNNPKYGYLKHNLGGVGSLEKDIKKKAHKVETIKLDQFVQEKKIAKIDLIKLDTEGTEDFILKGSIESIRRFQPIIICELLYNKIEGELETIFKNENYLFFLHSNGRLIPTATLRRTEDDGIRDGFFVPSSKIELVSKFIQQAG